MNHEVRFMIRSPERGAVRGGNCLFLGSMMTFFFQNGNPVLPFAKKTAGWWGVGGRGMVVIVCLLREQKRRVQETELHHFNLKRRSAVDLTW